MKRLTQLWLLFLVLTLPACGENIEAKAQSQAQKDKSSAPSAPPREPIETKAQTQAQKDIETGKPEYRIYGEPMARENILADILKTRYGVILHRVAGCIVTEELRKETAAYNAVVAAHLKKVHQKDVFAAAEAEFLERLKQEWEAPVRSPAPGKP